MLVIGAIISTFLRGDEEKLNGFFEPRVIMYVCVINFYIKLVRGEFGSLTSGKLELASKYFSKCGE